jgi:predicted Zn-ribbon and HTH transcriptional regulator
MSEKPTPVAVARSMAIEAALADESRREREKLREFISTLCQTCRGHGKIVYSETVECEHCGSEYEEDREDPCPDCDGINRRD